MKLFEIPIYRYSKIELKKRYDRYISSLMTKFQSITEETANNIIELETYPQRLWDYNHIIGYIVVKKEYSDIVIELYLPEPMITRYYWHSIKKIFLYNTHLNGHHFYIGDMKNGAQLKKQLHTLLDSLISDIEKKKYFVDSEAFESIDELLDYDRLLKG